MPERDFDILGDRKLEKKLERLARPAVQNRVMRRPMSSALTPINKAAKRKAPRDKGFLKKSIGKKVKTYRRGIWGGVGARTDSRYWRQLPPGKDGKPRFAKPHKYGGLAEFGTRHSAAKPFLRPALDEQRAAAIRILQIGVAANLEKEVLK